MKKLITTTLLIFGIILSISAQQIESFQVFMKPVDAGGNAIQTRDKQAINNGTASFQVNYSVKLSTTVGVSKLHIKLGSTVGGGQRATHVINMDGSNLPLGVALNIQGNMVYISLGTYNGLHQYYAEVKTEDANGNMGAPAEYSTIN
ncbi:MAG: hypothetical protein JKY42_05690 [Flavobacteriales bacterium]|nr:hypothetical protein [Flavobacteriales bacterium]